MSHVPTLPPEVRPAWVLAPTTAPRLLAGGGLVVAGLLLGRPDLAALGVPLVLSVLWGLVRRPDASADPGVDASLSDLRLVPGGRRVEARLSLRALDGVPVTRVRVSAPAHGDVEALVDSRITRHLDLSLTTVRTGRVRGFTVEYLGSGPGGVHVGRPGTLEPGVLLVHPQAVSLRELPLPLRLQGLTGAHASRRVGDGGDLRDVAPFAPGDRLRRIDWRTTARRSGQGGRGVAGLELHVRRTFALADAHVVLVLDARDAVGPDVGTWPSGRVHPDDLTSLDVARCAAASVARGYVEQGDRVGLVVLGRFGTPLRPGTGRRHLAQLVHQLALAEPLGVPANHVRAPQVPAGALVVMFSTFLDDESARLARTWRHHGHRTIAVDVLRVPDRDRLRPHADTAARIVVAERRDRIAALRASDIEVMRWEPRPGVDPRFDVALAASSRRRRARR